MEIRFLARKVAIGSSSGVIIPKALANLLKEGQTYEFEIKESQKKEVLDNELLHGEAESPSNG